MWLRNIQKCYQKKIHLDQLSNSVTTGWTTEGSEFESRYGQEFSLLQIVQTGSEVHPTS
jgi:hypothetical protein